MNRESNFSIKNINLDPKLWQVEYLKCFICQSSKQTKTKTKTVNDVLVQPTREGYASLCRNFASFLQCKTDSVPKHIALMYENSIQFEELMIKNSVRYHKQCRDNYNDQKLQRLENRCMKMRVEESHRDSLHISSVTAAEETVGETHTTNVPASFDESYRCIFQEIVKLIEICAVRM